MSAKLRSVTKQHTGLHWTWVYWLNFDRPQLAPRSTANLSSKKGIKPIPPTKNTTTLTLLLKHHPKQFSEYKVTQNHYCSSTSFFSSTSNSKSECNTLLKPTVYTILCSYSILCFTVSANPSKFSFSCPALSMYK